MKTGQRVTTLAAVAEAIADGGHLLDGARDFLDDLAWSGSAQERGALIAERPRPLADRRHEAFLAALAEHVAVTGGLPRPAWCTGPSRFLDAFWFPGPQPADRPRALTESPATFRRRGVLVRAAQLRPLPERPASGSALEALGRRLAAKRLQGDVYLVGGAVVALVLAPRQHTRDLAEVVAPPARLRDAAVAVAAEADRALPEDWLDAAVRMALVGPDPYDTPVLDVPGLRCQVAPPHVPLALIVLGADAGADPTHVRLLAGLLGLLTAEEVLDAVEDVLGVRLPPSARPFVEQALSS